MQETLVWFLGGKDLLEKDQVPTPVFLGFPGGSDGKESAHNVRDLSLIPGLRTSPGGGHDNPLLENPHGQRSLAGYSPWGLKESDTTEQLSPQHTRRYGIIPCRIKDRCHVAESSLFFGGIVYLHFTTVSFKIPINLHLINILVLKLLLFKLAQLKEILSCPTISY